MPRPESNRFCRHIAYQYVMMFLLTCCLLLTGYAGLHAEEQQPSLSVSEEGASPEMDSVGNPDCRQLAVLIQQQKTLLTRETGQLKREIAALRQDISKPGMKEVFAGIGYIFGLAGVGLYVSSRKDRKK